MHVLESPMATPGQPKMRGQREWEWSTVGRKRSRGLPRWSVRRLSSCWSCVRRGREGQGSQQRNAGGLYTPQWHTPEIVSIANFRHWGPVAVLSKRRCVQAQSERRGWETRLACRHGAQAKQSNPIREILVDWGLWNAPSVSSWHCARVITCALSYSTPIFQ